MKIDILQMDPNNWKKSQPGANPDPQVPGGDSNGDAEESKGNRTSKRNKTVPQH